MNRKARQLGSVASSVSAVSTKYLGTGCASRGAVDYYVVLLRSGLLRSCAAALWLGGMVGVDRCVSESKIWAAIALQSHSQTVLSSAVRCRLYANYIRRRGVKETDAECEGGGGSEAAKEG